MSTSRDEGGNTWTQGTAFLVGMLMVTLGAMQVLQAVAALADDSVYTLASSYAYELNLTAWGWIHLVLGAISLVAGLGILAGQRWALVLGLAVASLSAVGNFAFLPYYPAWSLVVIAFDGWVIWALVQELSRVDS